MKNKKKKKTISFFGVVKEFCAFGFLIRVFAEYLVLTHPSFLCLVNPATLSYKSPSNHPCKPDETIRYINI